jgi:hypothetical protein
MKITSSRVCIAKTDNTVAGRVRVAGCAPVAPAKCDRSLSRPLAPTAGRGRCLPPPQPLLASAECDLSLSHLPDRRLSYF